MAKVLACPACGFKHPLDLLVGLDSFMCKDCGKKLAVPSQAQEPVISAPQSFSASAAPKPAAQNTAAQNADGSGDVLVVARSSMSPNVDTPSAAVSPREHSEPTVSSLPANAASGMPTPAAATAPSPLKKTHMPAVSIPFFGRLLGWLISIPVGFVLVVLLPRFFGYGFHASDFVDVITRQGLGRYKIVVALVLLWSIATVVCVTMCNGIIRRIFHARKVA